MLNIFYCVIIFLFQSMAQFPWHDGSIKNVHVDPTLLFVYQVLIKFLINNT